MSSTTTTRTTNEASSQIYSLPTNPTFLSKRSPTPPPAIRVFDHDADTKQQHNNQIEVDDDSLSESEQSMRVVDSERSSSPTLYTSSASSTSTLSSAKKPFVADPISRSKNTTTTTITPKQNEPRFNRNRFTKSISKIASSITGLDTGLSISLALNPQSTPSTLSVISEQHGDSESLSLPGTSQNSNTTTVSSSDSTVLSSMSEVLPQFIFKKRAQRRRRQLKNLPLLRDLRRIFHKPKSSDRHDGPFDHLARTQFATHFVPIDKELGSGAGGTVRLIRRTTDDKIFAIKQFRARHSYESKKSYLKKVTAEFCIGSALHHENIIETLDIVESKGTYYEIMEFAPYDFFDLITSQKLATEESSCLFKQLLTAVEYLHSSGIAHRDLKLDNCVVTKDGILKLIDFGWSQVFRYPFSEKITKTKGAVGSDPYIAPESHKSGEYDPRPADIWSLGIIFVCMTIGRFPWMSAKEQESSYRMYLRYPNRLLKRLPEYSQNLVKQMLEPDPTKRATIQQIMADEWIKSIHVCKEGEVSVHHKHDLPEDTNRLKGLDIQGLSPSGGKSLNDNKCLSLSASALSNTSTVEKGEKKSSQS